MRFDAFLMLAVLAGVVATAPAQIAPNLDDLGPTVSKTSPIALSFNYTAMIGNAPPGTCGCFVLNGGGSEEVFYVWRNIAAVAEVSGNRSAQIPQSIQGLSLVTYMAGPRYSYRVSRRLTPYAQFLVGGAHGFDSYFPKSDSSSTGAGNSLALSPGGGVEVGVKSWLSLRAIEAEYLLTRLPNDLNARQHNLRLSTGIVFRFSTKRLNR